MKHSDFRILLVYANSFMDTLIPLSISSLASHLHEAGFDVRLFDTTFYKTNEDVSSDTMRLESEQVKDFSKDSRQFPVYYNAEDTFRLLVTDFAPHIIGMSCVEPTFPLTLRLIESISDTDIPIAIGGVFAIFAPEKLIDIPGVSMVCIGEGEKDFPELCKRIAAGEDYTATSNFWIKKDDVIYKNPSALVELCDENKYISPFFELFEEARFFRPMSGKVYRMLPLEFSRGCPYKCTYCSAPALLQKFETDGKWFRDRPLSTIEKDIQFYIENYSVEYLYFVSETFLAMSGRRFADFIKMYSKYRIPFWLNTRSETITEEKIEQLESIGCHRMSIGIEHGNYEFRKKMLKRVTTNEKIVEACRIVKSSSIELSVNNIIGFPDETKALIFDTIRLNRSIDADSHTALIFQPYVGTWLRQYCIDNDLYSAETIARDNSFEPVIKNRFVSEEEICELTRLFNTYRQLPESDWLELERVNGIRPEDFPLDDASQTTPTPVELVRSTRSNDGAVQPRSNAPIDPLHIPNEHPHL